MAKIYNKSRNSLVLRGFLFTLVETNPINKNSEKSGLKRLLKSEYFSLFFIFTISLMLLATKGQGKENQNVFFNNLIREYIGESAAYYDSNSRTTIIDVNSLSVPNIALGGEDNQYLLGTIQQNSLLSYGLVVESIDITDERNNIIIYTVQSGDVLSLIARDYGVSTNSLIWANNLKNADSIKPGQELKIPPVSGVIHTVVKGDTVSSLAKKYGANTNEIIEFNALPKDGSLQIGADIVIPGGEITTTPSSGVRYAKTMPFANLPKLIGYFAHPTRGLGRISQWLHGRNAIDVANPCGTLVYAAADGKVANIAANGWNGGYGRYIKVSHPNSSATLYAHLWDVLVSEGEIIARGQKIATTGSTGLSTGCHLHFETHGAQNPLTF